MAGSDVGRATSDYSPCWPCDCPFESNAVAVVVALGWSGMRAKECGSVVLLLRCQHLHLHCG
jgi:hypothetical protein